MTGVSAWIVRASRARRGTPFSWALAAALGLVAACPRPRPAALGPEPELRVGLGVAFSSVRLGGDGELVVVDDGNGQPVAAIPAGALWTVLPDSGGLILLRPDGSRTERHPGLSAVNVTEGHFAMANGHRYRGRVNLMRTGAGLSLVNRVPLESYVAGVLGQELGPRPVEERQAQLAQAVVSRTFALRNRGRWEMEGFDAFADTRDQVYAGVNGETEAVWDAVRATAGQVLRYRGELIDAFYHSTCCGRTAAVEEAFRSARRRPYLKPVSDASGDGRFYCERSPRFRWRAEWDEATLRAVLTRSLAVVMPVPEDGLQPITDVCAPRQLESADRRGYLLAVFGWRRNE